MRAVASKAGVLVRRDVPGYLDTPIRRLFGSFVEARRAAGLVGKPLGRRSVWNEKRIAAELRAAHARGVVLKRRELLDAGLIALVGAVDRAGGIVRMLRLARLPSPPRNPPAERTMWTHEEVAYQILERFENGLTLESSKVPPPLLNGARIVFGTWQEALAAAGIDGDAIGIRRRHSRKEILSKLADLHRRYPALTLEELRPQPVHHRLLSHFSSLDEALEAARIHGWPRRQLQPRMTRREALDALRARHRAGRSVRREDVRGDARLLSNLTRMFSTWEAACRAAGVPFEGARRWDRARVVAWLRARVRAGLSMNQPAVRADDPAVPSLVRKYLGPWREVYRVTGAKPGPRSRVGPTWTDNELLAALRELAVEKPRLTLTELRHLRIGWTAASRFGTLATALQRAELTSWPQNLRRPLPGRAEVVRLIRQRTARGDALTSTAASRDEPRLVKAARKYFGTWTAAVAAASRKTRKRYEE
jgi:hypothetical protein